MRRVLDDALAVEATVDAVAREVDLDREAGVLEVGLQAGHVVAPVDGDRRLTREHRRLVGDVGATEVAGRLQIGEELDAGHDVVGAEPPLAMRGGHDGGERRTGLTRVAVEGHEALVLRLGQVGEGLRSVRHDRGVGADRHDAVVGGDPVAVGILQTVGDLGVGASACTARTGPRRPSSWAMAGLTSTLSGMSAWPARVCDRRPSPPATRRSGSGTGFSTPGYLSRKLCRMPL